MFIISISSNKINFSEEGMGKGGNNTTWLLVKKNIVITQAAAHWPISTICI